MHKKNVIFLLLIFVSFFGCAEHTTKKIKKQLNVRQLETSNNNNQMIVEFYDSGQIKSKVCFKNGIQDGISKYYHQNGKLKMLVNISDGKIDGTRKDFFESGELMLESIFQKGILKKRIRYSKAQKKISEAIYKHDQKGNILSEKTYKNKLLNGIFREYYNNRKLKTLCVYKKGKKEGIEKIFDKKGNISQINYYSNGDIIKKKVINH